MGDAAEYIEPLSGEGMSWAMHLAARITPHAERAARGEPDPSAWAEESRTLLRSRHRVCSAVCRIGKHPRVIAGLIATVNHVPVLARMGRFVTWSAA